MSATQIVTLKLNPDVGSLRGQLRRICRKLAETGLNTTQQSGPLANLSRTLRSRFQATDSIDLDGLKLAFVVGVLVDLVAQGWSVRTPRGCIELVMADRESESASDQKKRVRLNHLQERDIQLAQPSVADFVLGMEKTRITKTGSHSIFSVMRDGAELEQSLKKARTANSREERLRLLSEAIDPYIQFVNKDERCSETGLRLNDIWRYFRHTWINAYRSSPGRGMMLLIRDRAVPFHPVIGIASLGSAVVQQSVRDSWIGWDANGAVDFFCKEISLHKLRWLQDSLSDAIAEVYVSDLLEDKVICRADLKTPTKVVIERLKKKSLQAIKRHRRSPDSSTLSLDSKLSRSDWVRRARTQLFLSKRCGQLAELLEIKRQFQKNLSEPMSQAQRRIATQRADVKHAVIQLVRHVKAARVGIHMMDVTVCGAVAPYNPLLGGKLVCLLLCSPEVTKSYDRKYREHVSIIASSISGKRIQRDPSLVLMCTTSLYGGGSSQYNRLKFSTELFGGSSKDIIEYKELGKSVGFGSFHFSADTIRVARTLLEKSSKQRKVNSIFGEGVNPLMRKMREALTVVNLPSDLLLCHGNERIVYGIPLARNFREILLNIDKRPNYLIPQNSPESKTRTIANHWRTRWLDARIDRPEVLDEVAANQLTPIIAHRARVPLKIATDASKRTQGSLVGKNLKGTKPRNRSQSE